MIWIIELWRAEKQEVHQEYLRKYEYQWDEKLNIVSLKEIILNIC